jgi:oligoribonuclease (3'-5' exoribonuclease)
MEKIDFLPEILKVSGLDTNGDKQVEYEVVLLQNVLEAMDVYAIYYHNRALADTNQENSASNIQAVSGSLPSDEEVNKMVNDFIDRWVEMNPTLDKNFYWSGVNDGVYILLNKLRGNDR